MRRRTRRSTQPLDDMKRPATLAGDSTSSEGLKLPALQRLLQNYYHQDAWLDFSKVEEIWADFLKHEPLETAPALLNDVGQLLVKGAITVREFLRSNADALGFRKADQYVTWAKRLKVWLEGAVSSNTSFERTREG